LSADLTPVSLVLPNFTDQGGWLVRPHLRFLQPLRLPERGRRFGTGSRHVGSAGESLHLGHFGQSDFDIGMVSKAKSITLRYDNIINVQIKFVGADRKDRCGR
jgi:hypothetical protein